MAALAILAAVFFALWTALFAAGPSLSPSELLLFDAINAERFAPLKLDADLLQAARARADDMVEGDYFAHFGGLSVYAAVRESGRRFAGVAEVIAKAPTVEQAVAGFMASPSHRRNVLHEPYQLAGVAAVELRQGLTLFVVVFAAPIVYR